MKLQNLLIPTDFSDKSVDSLRYTLALARDLEATVYVLHSYYVPVNTIETAYVADQAIWLEQARQQAEEEMEMLKKQQLEGSGVPFQCMVHAGPVMGDINKTIRDNKIDLVVMGTYETDNTTNFFGDLYTQAIRHAKAPVLLIPENTSYSFPQKIVFATDLKPVDNQKPLTNLVDVLSGLNARLELLHVHKRGKTISSKKEEELATIQQQFSALKPVIVLVESDDAEDGILLYAEQKKTNWLVAFSHHYGLLEGLFHSSHTKKLASRTNIPLLVSHE